MSSMWISGASGIISINKIMVIVLNLLTQLMVVVEKKI